MSREFDIPVTQVQHEKKAISLALSLGHKVYVCVRGHRVFQILPVSQETGSKLNMDALLEEKNSKVQSSTSNQPSKVQSTTSSQFPQAVKPVSKVQASVKLDEEFTDVIVEDDESEDEHSGEVERNVPQEVEKEEEDDDPDTARVEAKIKTMIADRQKSPDKPLSDIQRLAQSGPVKLSPQRSVTDITSEKYADLLKPRRPHD